MDGQGYAKMGQTIITIFWVLVVAIFVVGGAGYLAGYLRGDKIGQEEGKCAAKGTTYINGQCVKTVVVP